MFIAFSRNERTHPNLVSQASQAREIDIFCGLQIGSPSRFLQGFGPRFCVDLSRHACSLLWLLSLFLGVFFELVFNSDCIRQKRRMQSQCSLEWEFFGRAKTNYIIVKHVYTRRFVRDRSFLEVFILDRAWPVWSGYEMTCFCYTAGTTLFILFTNTTLNRLGFGMLTVRVGTAIFHWL